MFKTPTNQDVLEFIAQHVDVEVLAKIISPKGLPDGKGNRLRTAGRSRYFTELSKFHELRCRVNELAPTIAWQIASLSSDDIETQQQCVEHISKQLHLLECLYSSIRQRPIYTLIEQSAGNLALAEFFLLPYLKRLSHELQQTYPNNYFFHYLKRYVDIALGTLDNPMATFISVHKQAFRELSNAALFLDGYRKDRYKKLSKLIIEYSNENLGKCPDTNIELQKLLGWHIAGNIVHSVIKNVLTGGQRDDNALSIVQCHQKYYDNIYKYLLSLNVEETVFSSMKADENVALSFIFNKFMAYVDGFDVAEDFMSILSTDQIHQPRYNLLREVEAYQTCFCQRVYNSEISSEADVAHAQHLLKTIQSHYHLGCDAFLFAFYIFIAKYQNGQATKNEALTACEKVLLESGFDPFTKIGLHITVGNINDIDLTYAEHMRCRYVGYFNWNLKHKLSRCNFVNPIIDVDRFLISVIEPLDLTAGSDGREYALVKDEVIKENAKMVENPCVGVMKYGLKKVLVNLKFFEHVFQLNYLYPEDDDEVLDVGIWRYALLTEQQKKTLLGLIPDEPNRLNNVDMDLIPEL